MINEKESTRLSKFLSLVLRHQPETIGIALDEAGWADVELLIKNSNKAGRKLNLEILKYIVETNAKKRFSFDETQKKIRANQGHSVKVTLGYQEQTPPEVLYHGTGSQSVGSIFKTGLEKRQRHHVHLSEDVETAIKVGQRHGKPVVLEVRAAAMLENNAIFYKSANGVWLTDHVPPLYLSVKNI